MGEIEAEQRFFEPSKGESGRDDNTQQTTRMCHVPPPPLAHPRSYYARAVLVPRFVPESPHIKQLEELPL